MSDNRETYYLYAGRLFRDAGPIFNTDDDEPATIREAARDDAQPRSEDPSPDGQEPVGEEDEGEDRDDHEAASDEDASPLFV